MNLLKTIGKGVWNFLMAVGEARVQRDHMHMEAMRKNMLGR